MARANYLFHGFRPYSGKPFPQTIEGHVADNYGTDLYVGQPVARQSDGSYARVAAGTGAGISGVISRILQFRNSAGVVVTNGRYIPANTRWTAHQDRTMIEVIPATPENWFEVCGDEALASETVGLNTPGENADHIYPSSGVGAANQALGLAGVLLDTSTHNTTNTLQWRILGLRGDMGGPRVQNDPTQAYQVWVVRANVYVDVVAGGSATGV